MCHHPIARSPTTTLWESSPCILRFYHHRVFVVNACFLSRAPQPIGIVRHLVRMACRVVAETVRKNTMMRSTITKTSTIQVLWSADASEDANGIAQIPRMRQGNAMHRPSHAALRSSHIMVQNVPVVENHTMNFSLLTTSIEMARSIVTRWVQSSISGSFVRVFQKDSALCVVTVTLRLVAMATALMER